ncbi:hypothetical protein AOXY_G8835, partial [Acipenser oxyrinchus oxyrinchus]
SPQKRFPEDSESGLVSENQDPLRTPLSKSSNTGQPFESPLRYRKTPLKNKSDFHLSPSKSLLSGQSPALKNTTPEKKEAKSKSFSIFQGNTLLPVIIKSRRIGLLIKIYIFHDTQRGTVEDEDCLPSKQYLLYIMSCYRFKLFMLHTILLYCCIWSPVFSM